MHPFSCPNCKSKNVRSSLSQNFLESRLSKLLGIFQLRCRDCDGRWTQPIWDLLNVVYARCPAMLRGGTESLAAKLLSSSGAVEVSYGVGAKPRRCEFCRKNFVSFRPCKIRFVRRKAKPRRSGRIQPPLCSSIRLLDDSFQDHAGVGRGPHILAGRASITRLATAR